MPQRPSHYAKPFFTAGKNPWRDDFRLLVDRLTAVHQSAGMSKTHAAIAVGRAFGRGKTWVYRVKSRSPAEITIDDLANGLRLRHELIGESRKHVIRDLRAIGVQM